MIQVSDNLKKYLADKAEEYCKVVADFTHELAVYEDVEAKVAIDDKVWETYDKALDAVEEWLKLVLHAELMDSHDTISAVSVNLRLPSREICVSIAEDSANIPLGCNYGTYYEPEVLETPIGTMDYYTYRCLLDLPQNPVRMLYEHLNLCDRNLHNILTMYDMDEKVLCSDILEGCGVQDPLRIHAMDSLLNGVDHFFSEAV